MARSGTFRHKLVFQSLGETKDAAGNVVRGPIDVVVTRGNVRERVGREVLDHGNIEARRSATIRVRAGSLSGHNVTEAFQVSARGVVWQIKSIASADDKGHMLDILVETGVAS